MTMNDTCIDAVIQKESDTSYDVSTIHVAYRTVIQPAHRSGVMEELTNTACYDYVTTPQTTDNLLIPSCIISGGKEPSTMKVINGSSKQVVLKKGELSAIVIVTHHYSHYLLDREFTIRTDHGTVT